MVFLCLSVAIYWNNTKDILGYVQQYLFLYYTYITLKVLD